MNDSIIKKFDSIALYMVIYTAAFIVLYMTMPYILPFVFGTIIALGAQRPIAFFSRTLKINRGFIGVIVVLIFFALISSILAAIVVSIINELVSLSAVLPGIYNEIMDNSYKYLDLAASYYKMIDPAIINSIKGSANRIFSGSFTAAVFIVNFVLNILKSLPGFLMFILFTLLSAIYIAVDYPSIKNKIFSLMSKEDSSKAKHIILETNRMFGNYIKAYLILISITFIQTFIGTTLLQIKYGVLISILTSIMDLLPILGPGSVLIPAGIIYIIGGNLLQGVGLFVIFLVVSIVRQILEPKVVSSSLGVYPLAIIIAIFIGLKAYGFTGMIFTVFLVVFYVTFQKIGLI